MSNETVKREHRFASEVRASSSDAGKKLSGYAAVYNVPAVIGGQFNEVLRPGCFDACLAEDPDVRALWGHSDLTVLGRTAAGTLRLHTDSKGLFYEIDLPDTQAANDLWKSVSRKDVTGSSFGFYAVKENWIAATKPGDLPTREILAANIFDVSPCSFPAYEQGTTVDARSLMPAAVRDAMNTSNAGALIPSGGVVPFQKHNEKRDTGWDEEDAVNGIVKWASEEENDRSSGTNVSDHLNLFFSEPSPGGILAR
jgi:HK97 family phage prohead protease